MKNMKKLISMLLLACMITAMLSVSAFAAFGPTIGASVNDIKDNENVIFTVDTRDTVNPASVQLYVNGAPISSPKTFSGANTFTFGGSGLLGGNTNGTAQVYAVVSYADGTSENTNTVNVKVSPYIAPSISLSAYDLSLSGLNSSGSVEATILPSEYAAQGVEWTIISGGSVSLSAHPTIPNAVTVTAIAAGQTVVRAACKADYNLTSQFTVNVDVPVTDITFSPASLTMNVTDAAVTVNANVSPSAAVIGSISWTVNPSGVINVTPSSDGLSANIAPVAAGNATVYVTSGTVTREFHVTVNDNTQASISIAEGNTVTMTQGETKRFTANVTNASFTRWLIEQNGSYATLSNTQNLVTDLTALSTTNLGPIKLVAQARTNSGTYVEAVCYITINNADVLTLKANPQNITTGYTSTVSAANPLSGERFNWQYQLSGANVAVVQQHNNGEYVTIQAGSVDGYVTLTATSKSNANRTAQIVVYVNTTAPHGNATIYPTSATWTRGNGNLTFNVNPGVYWAYLDNTLLNNLGTSYATYYNGVLTLKSAYLSTLSSGTHTLKVYTSSNTNTSGQPDGLVYANIYINGSASNYGDSVHVKGSGYNLYFNASDPIRNVYISNTWIDPSNYSLDATGKQLTLNANFLNQLAYGNYTMRLDTSNGSSQTATFRIVAANYAPATGDENNIFVWITVLAISGAGVIALVPRKKKQM